MIILNPDTVMFDGVRWDGVRSVTIDREAVSVAEEWSDDGPHCLFVDVPRVRTTLRVRRAVEAARGDGSREAPGVLEFPGPGDEGVLRVQVGAVRSDRQRRSVEVRCVVLRAAVSAGPEGMTAEIVLAGVATLGGIDPVQVGAPAGGSFD